MRPAVLLLSLSALVLFLPEPRAADKDAPEGFEKLFNCKDLTGWQVNEGGKLDKWGAADGILFTKGSGGGWLMTDKEYADFELRLEFKVPKAGNSGVALRSALKGQPHLDAGMEIQILDDVWHLDKNNYKPGLKPTQRTGSIYGVVPPSKDALKPVGEWNSYRIIAKGRRITVELNGTTIVDANLNDHKDSAKEHPGILRDRGHIGLQSHDGRVEFRNLYVKPLAPAPSKEPLTMTPEQAAAFARLALKGVRKEYPNKLGDVLNGEDDVKPPRVLHPAFYGCFDWHSSVHGHWMLVRLLKQFPELPERKDIRAALAANLTTKNLQTEADTFKKPNHKSFERTYGWAWLLKLAEELHGWDDTDGREWSRNLRPLADAIAENYLAFLPKQTYPIRSGVHPNTAFGLGFALDYARAAGNKRLAELLEARSRDYYGKDVGIPAAWEPDGADFLSPSLCEADLMRRVLPSSEFPAWLHHFLPGLAKGEPKNLLEPATVTDRTDPQLVHLDGLNLSRAWCMRNIAAALPKDDPARKVLVESSRRHAEAALKHVASGDYAGEHWLASFAVYMLSTPSPE